ncbi:complement C4-like [Harpia harpyja]|uniref:complement C4-like n=1 Tax=Harpia harpyja TaxID=202280 RepID=UPI0022B1D3A0|nr:complement C4-like [Harpia harpyja]XP_052668936.1 complement C4-like [Harpia harpyja]XP_052668937.1 complement C4-like [Harpia harpyja]XP_052668938.1 complement C4-like [Harpia harpyja]XP_052668939.1 complement C4-like [Harpia harpyja]
MGRLVFLMSFCSLLSNTQQAPSYLITAPNVVHLGTHETVTVQVHGAQSPVQVTAYFKDEAKNQLLSERIIFNLNQNNNYQEMKKVMVKPGTLQQDLFKKSNQPYVLLVTESRDLYKETVQSTRILLSSKKGYIFIQTDKPIYTPSSKVKYRIFILDNAMRPTDDTVTVAVLNSKGMVVKKSDRKIKTVFSENFEIPDIAEPGTWKIKAWFRQYEMSNVSAEFEVKNYELPSFEVKLIPLQPYYHIWDENFVFDIEAKHSYGKGIQGAAYVRFGIIDEKEKKVFLPGLEQQLSIQNGKGRVTLNTPLLEEKLRNSISALEGFHLYVAVTTVETASGEMREEELSNVKFVKSPYAVDLSNTKKYFVPGAPFTVVASVTLIDGSPAASLPVTATVNLPGKTPMKKTAFSDKDGLIPFTFDIPGDAQMLQIMVKAEEGKEKLESPETSIRAERYQSASPNYLSISIPRTVVAPEDTLRITLNDIHQSGSGKIDYFYYMVVAKGQAELLGRVPSSNKIINLKITEKMVPAFRFLAYYFIENKGHQEIVADSVWVDVMDVCEGKIKVRTEQEIYEPTDNINLLIETDHAGTVALAAVDKAIFILNKKNKLTAKKVFNAMNSYDLGCSAGGGANSVQVFTDVGLAFLSDTIKSKAREGYKCFQVTRRQKRSLDFQKKMSGIASKYQNTDLQKCCEDGMKLNPMRFSCAKRVTKVAGSPKCRNAFQDCCEKATVLRKESKRRIRVGLARYYDDHEELFDETSVNLRSYFPESWWWNFEEVKNPGNHSVENFAPDSITTWEVQAISISPQKGFCIADPHTFEVFKDFFVSLRLPYSVRRHEQLEIKAVVYNYLPNDLQVTVTMDAVKGLCTAEATEKAVQLTLVVKGNSATPAYFSVVPLTVGEIPIIITAFDTISGHSDSIRKNLNVVAEGVLQREEKTICINSGLKSHTLDLNRPSDMVPGSDSHVFVSLKGSIMDEPVENCLSLTGVEKLIQVPTGCAEQTMVKMAPAVYAIEYLDASEQWVNFNPERKEEAINMIEKGYSRLLEFQKVDGSYGAFKTTPSSVWLTAFIVKVLIRCREYISVQDSHIRNSISYLINQQQADDSFHDHHPVLDRNMQGGIGSAEEDLALTAFVTIALQQTLQVYKSPDVVQAIRGVVAYMKNQLSRNTNCYSTVITAYALTLVQSDSEETQFAKEKLRSCSVFDAAKQQRYWGNGNDAVSVETTAYALLQTLLLKDMEYARPIATWLTERRNYGGGYCSTQDTVVALEALSAYSIQTLNTASTNLTVKLETPGRQEDYSITLTDTDEAIQKQLEFELGRKLKVSVHGRGNGTMSILKVYWSSELKNNTCNDLILTVEMEGSIKYSEAAYSDENEDYEDAFATENSAFEPLSEIEWFDIHSRRKRDVISPSKSESLQYKVCVRSTGSNAPKMSLVDLSLLSGLEPDTKDLEQLVMSSDQYIQHYEYKEGKVLLYFGELTSGPEPDCISFGAKQINPMGLVQPANAILYDFYNPDRKCSVFYTAPKHSAMLSKVCHANVCQCAEGPCPRQRSTFSKAITQTTRFSFVCYNPIADYAYEVELLNSTEKNVFDYYEAKIHRILKATADESIQVGAHRQFLTRSTCKLNMVTGKRYLLMGKDGQTVDCNNKMQYFLDAQAWVEKIPDDSECRTTLHRQACADLQDFMNVPDSLCLF